MWEKAPLTVTWVKINEYLGMAIYFSTSEKVAIQIKDYIKKVL